MIELTLAEIAEAVSGRLHRADGGERVTGSVEFDSRKVTDGGLFVALPGERADGHDFAASAVAAGAAGVLAAREVDAPAVIVPPLPPGQAHERSVALAGDTDGSGAAVLAALPRSPGTSYPAVGDRSHGRGGHRFLGKTSTTPDRAVTEPLGPTVAPGSFNNELGYPDGVACRSKTRTWCSNCRRVGRGTSGTGRGHRRGSGGAQRR